MLVYKKVYRIYIFNGNCIGLKGVTCTNPWPNDGGGG